MGFEEQVQMIPRVLMALLIVWLVLVAIRQARAWREAGSPRGVGSRDLLGLVPEVKPFASRIEFLEARYTMNLGDFLNRAYVTSDEIKRPPESKIVYEAVKVTDPMKAENPFIHVDPSIPFPPGGSAGTSQIIGGVPWSSGFPSDFPGDSGGGGAGGLGGISISVQGGIGGSGRIGIPRFKIGQWVRAVDNLGIDAKGKLVRITGINGDDHYRFEACAPGCPQSSDGYAGGGDWFEPAIPKVGEWWEAKKCSKHPGVVEAGVWRVSEAAWVHPAGEMVLCGCITPLNFGRGL